MKVGANEIKHVIDNLVDALPQRTHGVGTKTSMLQEYDFTWFGYNQTFTDEDLCRYVNCIVVIACYLLSLSMGINNK